MRMLSMRISSLRVCSAISMVWRDLLQIVFFTEGIKNGSLKNEKTDAYAEHKHQFQTPMLSMRTSSLRVGSACASVPDAYAQRTHKGRSIRIRKLNFLIFFEVPQKWKILKSLLTLTNGLKSSTEKKNFRPKLKKTSLKIDWAYA